MKRGVVLATWLCILWLCVTATWVLGADPTAAPGPLYGGDPRSNGAGPGIVGSPLAILGAVVLLGVVTAGVTIVVARVAQRR